ncbi:PREDICTED: F-box only protein 4 [Nanorana parkeri]|uniref:F-box only protein 4 n=1 Tax=Nanorana parkeri TaxID=125878 RepID=UPI000854C480|nr:PREDICTED: F-box only protein 4 [Nanorana parkeri]
MAEGNAVSAVEWGRLEAAIINGFRQLRDRYLQRGVRVLEEAERDGDSDSPLDRLPADMQLYILSFLTPQDLCRLGMTNHYWNEMVQDRLLWKYFLLRDLPAWSSIDCHSLPDVTVLNSRLPESERMDPNYMSIYLRSCPKTRKSVRSKNPIYGAVTSFLQSLVMQGEPRFAMFGPGLEQLDDSLVTRMMTSPDLLPVVSILQRQIDGIGSGVTFQLNSQHKFNILTLYSTTRTERDRARAEQSEAANKMFLADSLQNGDQRIPYTLIPQVKEVCRVVEGFIYVANAEAHKRHNREEEVAQIRTMMDPLLGPQRRPLLVLACVTNPGDKRVPCVYLAHDLCLSKLNRPWMVQNTEASTLSGLLEGIEWILGEVGKKL